MSSTFQKGSPVRILVVKGSFTPKKNKQTPPRPPRGLVGIYHFEIKLLQQFKNTIHHFLQKLFRNTSSHFFLKVSVTQNSEPLVHISLEKYYKMSLNAMFSFFHTLRYKYGEKKNTYSTVRVREPNDT